MFQVVEMAKTVNMAAAVCTIVTFAAIQTLEIFE